MLIRIKGNLSKLVPKYLENRHGDLVHIDEALAKQDYLSIEFMGHKMKGNASLYGFNELGKLGKKLERAAKQKNVNKIKEIQKEISNYLHELEVSYEVD